MIIPTANPVAIPIAQPKIFPKLLIPRTAVMAVMIGSVITLILRSYRRQVQ
jgi:hypothetical protein